jgi:hypothetical protein
MASWGSVPFEEQIKFFFQRKLVPTERWNDLWKDAHDAGFMVAGATKADLLGDLQNAVGRAIAEGTTLEQFRKDFDLIVQRHGWTGWTGEGTEAGRAWRTHVIYDTNLRQSYHAGRWAQMWDARDRRPFFVYRHNDGVTHPRPLHLSWDGIVVPIDSDWARTHHPQNGWGCQCWSYTINRRQLEKMGKSGPDTPPDDGTYEWTDKRTGEVHSVPKGIDPGFDYPPGGSRAEQIRRQVERKAAGPNLDEIIARKLLEHLRGVPVTTSKPWTWLSAADMDLDRVKTLGDDRLKEWLAKPMGHGTINDVLDAPWEGVAVLMQDIRGAVMEELRQRQGLGSVKVATWNSGGMGKQVLMRAAARYPDAWVSAANRVPVRVSLSKARGYYIHRKWNKTKERFEAFIRTSDSSTAEHEYGHHLQKLLPELDAVFQEEHRRRTKFDPLEVLYPYAPEEKGCPDHYVERYQGREYTPGGALEVLTMSFQALLGQDRFADQLLAKMLKFDQEILKVALGALFHFKP